MIFRQITHDDLGCASYLVGDEKAGVAAVVDPRFETDVYLELADYLGVRIEHILETHNHADHVSGHGRLAAATGATIHVHRDAAPAYDHEPFDDGWELQLGSLRIRALHTPGHRPEHTAFALTDTARSNRPWAVLTGDTLFVNDVARPDLAVERSEGARGIFHSLREKLLTLPDDCEVWPGHLGGSMCGGAGIDMKISSTIGFEKQSNPTLSIVDENDFVADALAKLGPQPPNFHAIVDLNRGPLLTEDVAASALSAHQVEEQRAAGALVVDLRSDREFDDAHVPGAVWIPVARPGFGTKLAWLARPEQPIVFVGRDDADGRRAARLAAAVGLRAHAGYLQGGMTAWEVEERPVERIERLPAAELAARLEAEPGLQLLDVRERHEWEEGHLPGSRFAAWHDLAEVPEGIDPERPVATICLTGPRAGTAAGLLQRFGCRSVVHVAEGG
ncbi:MAG TPA: MBL fold metallo-hydrolase, partial [Gaiellaceae bacterium]|nr:MBL fold metallo-hydrolase [Gaiellaceae bacterium]